MSVADEILKYFEGRTPSVCATCSQSPEARPGVRLCRTCLEVAWTVAEAIHEQEERAALEAAAPLPRPCPSYVPSSSVTCATCKGGICECGGCQCVESFKRCGALASSS
jgi:hypothetical protein